MPPASSCVKLPTSILLLIITLLIFPSIARSADAQAKAEARAEERMKDEKKRDEQSAKDQANKVKVARFDSVWRPPKNEDIDVYQAGESLTRPFKAAAFMTFECAAHEEAQAIAGFIAKAKDLGCDGVVILRYESPNINQVMPTLISPNDRRVFRANAIIYPNTK